MFTLRIILTGLLSLGPLNDTNVEASKDVWALMAHAPSSPTHYTQIRWGCTSDGVGCSDVHTVSKSDIQILIDGQPLEVDPQRNLDARFRIDYTFREHVVDLYEISNVPRGDFSCSPPPPPPFQKILAQRRTPAVANGLLDTTIDPARLGPVNSRLYLAAGGELTDTAERCKETGVPYCGGRLSAAAIQTCQRWQFDLPTPPPMPTPLCTRMANQIIFDLQVANKDVSIQTIPYQGGPIDRYTVGQPTLPSRVIEVWISHSPTVETVGPLAHFDHLYDLFESGIDHRRIPTPVAVPSCNDLPGTFPIKCPVTQFGGPAAIE